MDPIDEKPHFGNREKGRRHGYNKLKTKRDRSQATFGKFFVNPEKLSKKQRERVIRVNDAQSEFAINVQYSLNRKYRWEQISGADDLVAMEPLAFPDNVKVDGCDGAYALCRDVVVTGHYERNADGEVQPTTNHAFWLADPAHYVTRKNKNKPVDEDGKVIPEIRYVRATVSQTRYANFDWHSKNTFGGIRRGRQIRQFDPDEWVDEDAGGDREEEDCDTEDTRKRPDFTVADFIVDNHPPPPPSSSSSSQWTLANSDDCGADKTENEYSSIVDLKSLCKDSFFFQFTTDGSQLGCPDGQTFDLKPTKWFFRWLNSSKTGIAVDLSDKLHPGERNVVSVVIIERLKPNKIRITLNGSFPVDEEPLSTYFSSNDFKSLDEFLEACVIKLSKSYEASRLSTLRDAYDSQTAYYPKKLIETNGVEPQTYPTFSEINVPDIVGSFEVVKLKNNVVTECKHNAPHCNKCDSDDAPVYQVFKLCSHAFCRDCLQSGLTTSIVCEKALPLTCIQTDCTASISDQYLYALLPLPVANFYFNAELKTTASKSGKTLIECPRCDSMATIQSTPIYKSVACWNCSMCFCLRCKNRPHFPLTCDRFASWATKFELQYYLELSRKNPDSVRTCTCGSILYQAHEKVYIQTCQDCGTSYYWSWRYKVGDQKVKMVNFADETTSNFITTEYSDICLPIHELRFNMKAVRDLKNCLLQTKLDTDNVQLFVSNYKLALHLIELGFAWLYLTKAQKPNKWATLKTHLTQLRNLIDGVITSVRQRLPLVDANYKVIELKKLVDMIMDLFKDV